MQCEGQQPILHKQRSLTIRNGVTCLWLVLQPGRQKTQYAVTHKHEGFACVLKDQHTTTLLLLLLHASLCDVLAVNRHTE